MSSSKHPPLHGAQSVRSRRQGETLACDHKPRGSDASVFRYGQSWVCLDCALLRCAVCRRAGRNTLLDEPVRGEWGTVEVWRVVYVWSKGTEKGARAKERLLIVCNDIVEGDTKAMFYTREAMSFAVMARNSRGFLAVNGWRSNGDRELDEGERLIRIEDGGRVDKLPQKGDRLASGYT